MVALSDSKPHRKPRSDRNHVVYLLTCKPTGETYVGLTVVRGQAIKKSVGIRFKGHVHHAVVENRPFLIHKAIRLHGAANFSHEVLAVVRGKEAAHIRETHEIKERRPLLNMESMGRKANSVHKKSPVRYN